jgi:PAS domain S-box-containing protein
VQEIVSPSLDSEAATFSGDIRQLMVAFEEFQKLAANATTSYQRLQATVEELDRELELKNRELEASLQTQQRLHHSLRSIVDSLHHGVIAVDLEGRVTLFNRRASELTGCDEEAVVGMAYRSAFPEHPPILLNTLETARPEVREFENYLGDGDARRIEVTTALVRDDNGVVLGAVEVLHDLTDVRKMEAQLRQAKVLADLGEMSVSIAHEIRNPLGAIQLFVEMLRDDALAPPEREKVLDDIFMGIRLMNNTISNLLQFSRPVVVAPDFQNLAPLLDRSVTLSEHALRVEGIVVRREYPSVGLMCHVDEQHFVKAMLNLILNAVQAMDKKEPRVVTLRAARREPSSDADVGVPWIEVEVEDNGCGIPPGMVERIFTPFVTTKVHGVGLGLPIVHKIIQAHGGKISIRSADGSGTCVHLEIPVYRPFGNDSEPARASDR